MTSLVLSRDRLPFHRAGLPFFGNLLAVARSPLDFFAEGVARSGPFHSTAIGSFRTTVAVEPAAVEAILKGSASSFVKDENTRGMRWLLGMGMLTSDGEPWQQGRRSAAKDFHASAFGQVMSSLHRLGGPLCSDWERRGRVDVSAAMADLSLSLICDHLFGPDVVGPDSPLLSSCLAAWAGFFEKPFNYFVLRSPWPPLPAYRRIRALTAKLDGWFAEKIEQARRKETATTPLDRISHFRGTNGALLSVQSVRDQIITLILTGHETLANAMAWTLRFLAESPEVQAELRPALPALSDDPQKDLELLKARALPPLLEAVVLEGLRLRPPAWCVGREAIEDVDVLGHSFRAGAHFTVPVAVLHTQERHFPEPDRFLPQRWLSGSWRSSLHRFAYVPFGGGPHTCLGQGLAMAQMQWLLWRLIKQFEFSADAIAMPSAVASISLRPSVPIELCVRRVAA
jgi:cytochrome P450